MRVSDLVKDVIFLVGSMECFSQVEIILIIIYNKMLVFCWVNMSLEAFKYLSE